MLALALHKAPDELLASICDALLTKIDNAKQSGKDVQSVTAVAFLSGVLLIRIRTLILPASRLLLRAVEYAVKKMPTLTISCVLARMVQSCPSINDLDRGGKRGVLIGHPQFELMQRVTRQILSKDQSQDLIRDICCLNKEDLNFEFIGTLFDGLLSAIFVVGGAIKAGKGKKKDERKGRESGVPKELSISEQDQYVLRWGKLDLDIKRGIHVHICIYISTLYIYK